MRRRLAISLAVLAAALGAAACGDDENDGGSAAATEEQAQRQDEPAPGDLKNTSRKPQVEKPTGSPPRRLEKEDIVIGKGRRAKPGDTLTMHYVGVSFSTGEQFDASWDRGEPFPFELGAGQVIPGWDRGIVGMRKGGRREPRDPARAGLRRAGIAARDRAQRDAHLHRRRARHRLSVPRLSLR